jgi:hypothetical protein
MVFYERAKEILATTDRYLSTPPGKLDCFDFRVRCGAVYLYTLLGSTHGSRTDEAYHSRW